jgi:hypothetical protein
MRSLRSLLVLAFVVVAVACTKEGVKAGDPCNGPGSCKAPLTCVEGPKGSACGSTCDFVDFKKACKDPTLAPTEVTARGLPAGCYCLPK